MADENECPKCPAGLPAWLATFADLMSLLMCFFVLLLSFATIDAVRFKKMAESMKDAFGVQREIPAAEIVMGVSVIKQEWSPSISEQAVITEIRQETSDEQKENLKMNDSDSDSEAAQEMTQAQLTEAQLQAAAAKKLEEDIEEQLSELQEALKEEIEQGMVALEKENKRIIIRIQEKGSFSSGRAKLEEGFQEVMDRVSTVLAARPGQIVVAGHTDNIPIRTGRFRSNWELSSARAVTVLHSLIKNKDVDPNRIVVEGRAETQPIADNATRDGRAKNRRVELIILRGKDEDSGETLGLGPEN